MIFFEQSGITTPFTIRSFPSFKRWVSNRKTT